MPISPRWWPCSAPSSRAARHRALALLGALCALIVGSAPTAAHAQDRFGVGLQLGRSDTLTPYRRNIVLAEPTGEVDSQGVPLVRTSLADEQHAWSTSFALEVQLDQLEFTLRALWLTRDTVLRHHTGDSAISQQRERADGTYDDAGVLYTPVADEELRIPQRGRGELLIATLGGGRRFSLYDGAFGLFAPVGGGLTLIHVDEPGLPYRFGLHAYAGAGASFRFAQSLELAACARLIAIGTFEYEPDGDAARRGAQLGEGTLPAMFSTTLLPDIGVTITYLVR
jgi:hypothetical protein